MVDITGPDSCAVDIQLTEQDFPKYSKIVLKPFRLRMWSKCAVLIGCSTAFMISAVNILRHISFVPHNRWVYAALVIMAYFVAYTVFSRALGDWAGNSYHDKRGSFLAPCKLIMTKDCLTTETTHGHNRLSWPGVLKIEDTGDYFLFYIDKINAYIVPKRSFTTADAAQKFIQNAHVYWQAANGNAVGGDESSIAQENIHV